MSESFVHNMTNSIARNLTMRIDQQVRVCIKPKPRFMTQRMWLKLAAIFIQIEKTQPSFTALGQENI